MTRVVKRADVRRDEIMDAAERLFVAKGYAATTINDLLDATGIARGTLYHHFSSKEQVLDGLIRRQGDRLLAAVEAVAASEGPALPKLAACVASLAPQDDEQTRLIGELSGAGDAVMFHKSQDDIVLRLAPVVAKVVEQGVAEGVLHTDTPLTAVRVLLAAAHALFDNPGLAWTPQEHRELAFGLVDAAERVLGAKSGSLASVVVGIAAVRDAWEPK